MNSIAVSQPADHKVRFVYVDVKKQRVTVAYSYDNEHNMVRFAAAKCSKRDRFVKRIGRDIAVGRLTVKGGIGVSFDEIGGTSYRDIARFVSSNIKGIAQTASSK